MEVMSPSETPSEHERQRLIVNCLPLTPDQRHVMKDAAPSIPQVFAAPDSPAAGVWLAHIPPELTEAVTAVIGNVDPAELSRCPHLEWLQTWSAGIDQYTSGLHKLPDSMVITNASGAYGQVVSEHMFAMMWAVMKNLQLYARHQAARQWQPEAGVLSPRGGTALVVGTGDIGSHFAMLAKSVGMQTIGVRRHANIAAEGIDQMHGFADLDALLPKADVVALIVPAAPDTHHLLDARRLALLKSTAILLNAGRGDAIDPDALAAVLHNGQIHAAAIDVTEPEPLPEHSPLWDEPRCLITPHVAGEHLPDTDTKIKEIVLSNIKRYASGSLKP